MTNFKFDPVTGTLKNTNIESAGVTDNKMQQVILPTDDEKASVGDVIEKQQSNIEDDELLVSFREKSDYTIFQIIDKDTGSVLAYIGGYALDFSFNLKKLNSTSKVEQCLDGIKKLFRKIIMDKILNNDKKDNG